MADLTNVSKDFNLTLLDSDLKGISVDMTESILDSALEDGLAKDIPVLRSIVAIIQTTKNISGYLFFKKILSFLQGIDDIDPVKRREMIEQIDRSSKDSIKVGERLIYIIDKSEDHTKSYYIGRLFRAFVNKEISYPIFLKCAKAVDMANLYDLREFITQCDDSTLSNNDYSNYITIGVVSLFDSESIRLFDSSLVGVMLSVGKLYPRINEVGFKIKQILLPVI